MHLFIRLDPEEQQAVVHLMVRMALVDGQLSDTEVEVITPLATLAETSVLDAIADASSPSATAQAWAVLHRPEAARVAVLWMLELAHADGDYGQAERDAVLAEASRLGLDIERIDAIESWVEERRDHRERERELLEL